MLYVVGLGSGSIENMTKEAFDTLESCSLIVGYGVYVDLIKDHFPHKEYYTTPMKQEIDRCKYAIEQAERSSCYFQWRCRSLWNGKSYL